MANSYFHFKQFTVWQDQCAMKVGTLACILGAYASATAPKQILDIGAGTGLLALMLAQRFPEAAIDAVEIEAGAFRQASVNLKESRWKSRIHLIHGDILGFSSSCKYDLIVSNPPFFEKYLKSPDDKTNLARHNDHLPFAGLLAKVKELLAPEGSFYVLLPPFEMKRLENLALAKGLFPKKELHIYNFPGQPAKAVVSAFSHEKKNCANEALVIRDEDKNYTSEFISMLKDFYLHF